MQIKIVWEFDVNKEMRDELQLLLCECFGEDYPKERIYFKQRPHFRVLAYKGNHLIGHIACDYRTMNLNGHPINALSLIDVCVSAEIRSEGIASQLLSETDKFCQNKDIDFIVLFADNPVVYERNGFKSVQSKCTWLKINDVNLTTKGIGCETINELMVKSVGEKKWEDGELDLLGYLG
ncbi:GNAT family N-acetyltransferase [Bacillus sp. BHET2]|nr:GNAT family N-acetyltransferase [Bacillus sp. BHET2]